MLNHLLVAKVVSPKVGTLVTKPRYSARMSKLGSLARALGPLVANAVYDHIHVTAQFVVAGMITAVVAIWMSRLSRLQTVEQRGFEVVPLNQNPETEATLEST